MKCPYCKGTGQCEENTVDTFYRIRGEVEKRAKKQDGRVEIFPDHHAKSVSVNVWPWTALCDETGVRFFQRASGTSQKISEGPSDLEALAKAAYSCWKKTGTVR